MSITAQRPDSTTNATVTTSGTSPAPQRSRHGRLLAGLLAALTLVTVATVVMWNLPHTASPSTPQDLSAYAQGGSVYDEQVPAAVEPWPSKYGPGSTVYREQVPGASVPWTSAYGPGSTVYRSQIPSVARPADLSAYEFGGSVYSEQVPSSATSWVTGYGPKSLVYSEQVPTTRRP